MRRKIVEGRNIISAKQLFKINYVRIKRLLKEKKIAYQGTSRTHKSQKGELKTLI